LANDSIASAFKQIDKSVKSAATSAMNKAVNSTRAKYAKDISATLGISSSKAKSRSKIFRATGNFLKATLSIGTKIQLAAQDFKTAKIKVMSSRGLRVGATYFNKAQGRLIAPKGVIIKGKGSGKNLVLTNKGKHKYETVRVDGFESTVEAMKPELDSYILESFKKNFKSTLDYLLGR
jgi:hypothetical protein